MKKQFKTLIPKLAEAVDVKAGELVLLHFWGENEDLDVVDAFAVEIAKQGAIPVKWQQSRLYTKDWFAAANPESLELPEAYFNIFKAADTVIDLCMYMPPAPHKDFPQERMNEYRGFMMKLFQSLTEGKEKFIQIRIPTEETAAMAGMSLEEYGPLVMDAMDVDYGQMKQNAKDMIKQFDNVKEVAIETGDHKLTFSIDNRPWQEDHGIGDFPAGEVYLAPIEESANGSIAFPVAFVEGRKVEDLTLTFENGVVTQCSDSELAEMIKECPGPSDRIGEFGIGLNPKVTQQTGYALLDEKQIGTVHIALGMNTMYGGQNDTPLHMDFVVAPSRVVLNNDSELAL